MEQWLYDWITRGLSGLQSLANAVATAIAAVYGAITSTIGRWLQAFAYILRSAQWCVTAAFRLASATWHFALWEAQTHLPKFVAAAVDTLRRWANSAINAASNILHALIDGVRRLAQSLVNELRTLLTGLLDKLGNTVGKAVKLLAQVAKMVFTLLTDPAVMATWIAGHIVQAVARWARGNAETLVRIIIVNAVRATYSMAGLLERIIVDLFL